MTSTPTPFLVSMRRFEAANGGRPFPRAEEKRLMRLLGPTARERRRRFVQEFAALCERHAARRARP